LVIDKLCDANACVLPAWSRGIDNALPLVTSQLPFFVKPTLLSTHGVSSLYRCISVRQVLVVVWEAQVNAAVQCRVQPAAGHGLFLGEEIKALGAICLRVTKQRVLKSAEGVVRHWHWDGNRSEEHTSELQSRIDLVCRLLLAKKKWH